MSKRIRQRMETGLTQLGLLIVPLWPRGMVLVVARMIGWIAYVCPSRLKQVGLANLQLALGRERTAQELRHILLESYQTAALAVLDMFWFTRNPAQCISQYITFPPELDELFTHKAHICITAHMGNWELLGHAVSIRGYPLASVVAPLINEKVDELFGRMRTISGQVIVPQRGAIRTLLRFLREDGKAGLLLDQNLAPNAGGVFVDFFGLPVPVSDTPASLALKTQTDILFGFCIPDRRGYYHVHTRPKITPPKPDPNAKHEQSLALTQQILAHIESIVREHPGSWLWVYKRWKFLPPDADPKTYPFYAKHPLPPE